MRRRLQLVLWVALVPTALFGQGRGDYFNVESPQVHPVEVAHVGKTDVLLVANTPDNTVEVWTTVEDDAPADRFLFSVRVGLEPVSVRYSAVTGRFYTANFLGDSVTVVRLSEDPEGELEAVVEQTRYVGDEPVDIAISRLVPPPREGGFAPAPLLAGAPGAPAAAPPGSAPGGGPASTSTPSDRRIRPQPGPRLYVTHATPHAMSIRHAITLDPVFDGAERVHLIDPSRAEPWGLREPHAVATRNGHVFALGFKGGNSEVFDFDLFVGARDGEFLRAINGLGSTNWNMALSSSGDVFVVGGEALNDLEGEEAVSAAPTGFVKSTLYWVADPTGAAVVRRLDLNALVDDEGQGLLLPVAPADALAMPTDVAVFEPAGGPTKVFVTAFGSDRVGVVEPVAGQDPTDWARRVVEVPPLLNPTSGPRGLALKPASPRTDARLYVGNRLDGSVTIIDPVSEAVVGAFSLQRDPTPAYLRPGRALFYSARLTSGNGFVSCASCHTDGRTDGLRWHLGLFSGPRDPFPVELTSGLPADLFNDGDCLDAFSLSFADYVENGFPPKTLMVTQSLQGLLNYEVEPGTQSFFTNAPYHWRGDRNGVEDFNGAFVNLQGMPGIGSPPVGLSADDMADVVEFIHSIQYPPNPEQALDRVLTGTFGPADSADDITVGSGAQLGMKLFHTVPLTGNGGRSCVHCHALPEGSNNHLSTMTQDPPQPLESPALRGLLQKQKRLDVNTTSLSPIVIGDAGFLHRGGRASINNLLGAFSQSFVGEISPGGVLPPQLAALAAFLHELDWGVAPIVGRSLSVGTADLATPGTSTTLDLLEGQAEVGNAGLSVQAWIAGEPRAMWWDVTKTPPAYLEEASGLLRSRAALLALVQAPDDLLVFQSVPLGSERRVGTIDAGPPATPFAPSSLELVPARPNTALRSIPLITKNWAVVPAVPDFSFDWTNVCGPSPAAAKAIRLMQYGLLQSADGFGFSDELHHEAPRRLRVAGHGIAHSATLHLHVPTGPTPPDPGGALGAIPTRELVLPLHPTVDRASGDRVVWETAVELEPRVLYTLMMGGAGAPGVAAATSDTFDQLPRAAGPRLLRSGRLELALRDRAQPGRRSWPRRLAAPAPELTLTCRVRRARPPAPRSHARCDRSGPPSSARSSSESPRWPSASPSRPSHAGRPSPLRAPPSNPPPPSPRSRACCVTRAA